MHSLDRILLCFQVPVTLFGQFLIYWSVDIENDIIGEQMSYLVAVDLHDRRPSPISTSKISKVTENGNWF